MAQLESKLEARFRKGVRAIGGRVYKLAPTVEGMPDRMVLLRGRVMLVELKREGEKPRPIQLVRHAEMAACGVTVTVLAGATEIDNWIEARSNE